MIKSVAHRAYVTHTTRLTSNVQRIHLSSEELSCLTGLSTGAYIKLLFDSSGQAITKWSELNQVAMRTYTVSQFNPANSEFVLDMVLHNHNGITGPASAWARLAKKGDCILFAGPGSSRGLPNNYDWVLFAGDLTALPAIKAHLARLAPETKGFAVIQVEDERDITEIDKPESIEVIWNSTSSLPQRLKDLPWMTGTPGVWVACEFTSMKEIRMWLSNEKNIDHQQIYVSSYWKQGRSEDQHKIDKRLDSEAFLKQLNGNV